VNQEGIVKTILAAVFFVAASAGAVPWTIGNGCGGTCIPPCRLATDVKICAFNATWSNLVLACTEDQCRPDPSIRYLYWRKVDDAMAYRFPPAMVCPTSEGAVCPEQPRTHYNCEGLRIRP
jgi:hypothetical protein